MYAIIRCLSHSKKNIFTYISPKTGKRGCAKFCIWLKVTCDEYENRKICIAHPHTNQQASSLSREPKREKRKRNFWCKFQPLTFSNMCSASNNKIFGFQKRFLRTHEYVYDAHFAGNCMKVKTDFPQTENENEIFISFSSALYPKMCVFRLLMRIYEISFYF